MRGWPKCTKIAWGQEKPNSKDKPAAPPPAVLWFLWRVCVCVCVCVYPAVVAGHAAAVTCRLGSVLLARAAAPAPLAAAEQPLKAAAPTDVTHWVVNQETDTLSTDVTGTI